ncbi:Brp/Blh family beta-carotene 15,15'-dioxygenase [Sphingomonas insulae]|uniref:Probable beta-carotene 15,15'-dioxygenase n=1 Tax=Sphingomonas insulae TaxID=424800 RepID=A0ABP3SW30_9SPHN|nr:Brp/Blh family beta-carotene 15,15'-dioxygenase [Sphingomonas insulae]
MRAPAIGWGVLLAVAAAAAFGGLAVQLAFAVVAIGVVGMAHGASDLAIVAPARRASFIALYGLVGATCLWWWVADPAIALPAFLIASAVHFGLEDAPEDRPLERVARGISLVATPATLHMEALADILRLAGTTSAMAMAAAMAVAGGAAATWLLVCGLRCRDTRLLAGTVALIVLPPLVGFSVGFLILHAVPQTVERRARLGCATTAAYLRATAPVLVAALFLVVLAGGLLLRWDPSGVRPLFAGIAALAVPHLLVTPWFEQAAVSLSLSDARTATSFRASV